MQESLRIELVIVVETFFNFTVDVNEATLSILFVFFPYANVKVATGIDVSTITMLQLIVELALIDMRILGEMSSNAFSLVVGIKLSNVVGILYFNLTVVQLWVEVDGVVLLDV